jgi:glycosyltransferase involved in cell wall biosynthesis
MKRFVLQFATTVPISRAIAGDLTGQFRVVGNPYDAATFRQLPDVKREHDLVFLGRLVFDKGAHLVLEALALLKRHGRRCSLTVVGIGPEEGALRRLVVELDLQDQVHFVGAQAGVELARTLNAHKILVVPSLWQEPFGVVALEGCACGCVVVGSAGGGLPEAIGPCGLTFPNGDPQALADQIERLLSTPALLKTFRAAGAAHVATHTPAAVADAYIEVFQQAILTARDNR